MKKMNPVGQPRHMIAVFVEVARGMLQDAEQYRAILTAKGYICTDASLSAIEDAISRYHQDIELYGKQCKQWRLRELTHIQKKWVSEIKHHIDALQACIEDLEGLLPCKAAVSMDFSDNMRV